jgi:hypothetical protein
MGAKAASHWRPAEATALDQGYILKTSLTRNVFTKYFPIQINALTLRMKLQRTAVKIMHRVIKTLHLGANPTIFKFTATTPALYVVG